MLNLILGKPKLDFYFEIALAYLPQLDFKVCEIAPQAGFLRFLQKQKDDFSSPNLADCRHNHHSGTPQTSPQTLKIIQVDTGECTVSLRYFQATHWPLTKLFKCSLDPFCPQIPNLLHHCVGISGGYT